MAQAALDWVIDVDTHITEPGDLWTSRLPKRFLDRAPRLVRNPENQWDVWHVGDYSPLVPVGFTAVAGWKEPFPAAPRNMDEVPKAAFDARARLAYMDSLGIWAMAIYPNVGGFGSQAFLKLGDPELMLACVQAYNDFLTEWISPDPRRFIPICATPFWDVAASVKEIERCAKRGHKGVLFTGEPQTHGQPILGDHHWDPNDPAYVDYDAVPFDVTQETIMPRDFTVELNCAVADRLDEGQQIKLANEVTRFTMSSILHGEQGALSLSTSLVQILRDPGAQEYASNQAREEARHVNGFSRYIAKRWGGPVETIRPGDVVWIAPGEKHWHGAAPATAMTHIAVQERFDGKAVEWMEHVTDEQYQAESV